MCAGALSWCWAIAFRAKLWWWEGCNNQDDVFAMAVLALLITAGISSYLARRRRSSGHGRTALPPGPTGLPLLGSLPFLGGPDLHRSFAELAKAYGPVMSIRLGTKLCLVVSSPAAAKEVLKDHDAVFANRDVPAAARVINYGGRGIGWNSSPASWRVLRKMTARELLNPSTVNEFYSLRRSEVRRMVREVHRRCGTPVRVGEESSLTSLDVITNMMWGSTVEGEERKRQVAKEFGAVVTEINDMLGAPNVSDLIPALARFDLQGVERRMRRLHVLCDRILSKIMGMRVRVDVGRNGDGGEGRRISGGGGRGCRDFLQVMLEVVESTAEAPLTVDNLKAVMMDMVLAGGDTSAATVEWAMAEMMRNREILGKAQEELDRVVGKDAAVEESHLPSLRYLDAVVKETFRLHPVVPLLLPRCSGGPCLVEGHHVPSNTRVFVNVWAIHRDPSSWEDPLEFKPERFMGDDGTTKHWDYRGGGDGGFRFLPFGLGRRMCVGISLGKRMTMFLLATLIHSFHWRLPAGEDVDMTEAFGLILRMARPLSLVPTPRSSNLRLYE